VDTTQTITHIGLCAGYGGIELGLKRVLPTMRSVALCEIEAFAIANLVAKMEAGLMDPAPIWTDLKTFPWEEFRDKVDVLSGGYPCQPFSAAGKRLGTDDPRHLWPYIASGIRLLRPKLCFFENVEGHISLGLREVIADLESLGYETAWGIFSAAECGAPHQRKRVFIMAVAGGLGGAAGLSGQIAGYEGQSGITDDCSYQRWPSRPGQLQHAWEPPRVVANPRCGERGGRKIEQGPECGRKSKLREAGEGMGNASDQRHLWAERQGSAGTKGQPNGHTSESTRVEQHEIESTLGGDSDGPSSGLDYAELCVTCDNRTDELRLLGNGVVPATAELAFRTLLNQL
jgi:DNA (cytosine-5)-methyltransferase 1